MSLDKSFSENLLLKRGLLKFRFQTREIWAPNYTSACLINDLVSHGNAIALTADEINLGMTQDGNEFIENLICRIERS